MIIKTIIDIINKTTNIKQKANLFRLLRFILKNITLIINNSII